MKEIIIVIFRSSLTKASMIAFYLKILNNFLPTVENQFERERNVAIFDFLSSTAVVPPPPKQNRDFLEFGAQIGQT